MLTMEAIFILFMCALTGFVLKWSHVITMLLSLELAALALFLSFVGTLDQMTMFLFLILVVSDSVVGLMILILMVRTFGNDYTGVMLWT